MSFFKNIKACHIFKVRCFILFLLLSFFSQRELLSYSIKSNDSIINSTELGFSLSQKYLCYNESNLIKFFGFLTGGDVFIKSTFPFGLNVSFEFNGHIGKKINYVGFTGITIREPFSESSVYSSLFYFEQKLGYDIPLNYSVVVSPYIGLGYRRLNFEWKEDDQIINDPKTRLSRNGYYFIGLNVSFRLSAKYFLIQEFSLGKSFSSTVSYKNYPLDYSRINDIRFDNGMFFKSSLKTEVFLTKNVSLLLNLLYRYLSLGESESVYVHEVRSHMVEPQSSSHELSLGLGVNYSIF